MKLLNAGVNPSGLVIIKDRYLLVANNNNYEIPDQDTVSVFDLKHDRLVKTLNHSSFNEPYTISYHKANHVAYVCNSGSPSVAGQPGTITLISTIDHSIIGTIESNQLDGPSGMAIVGNYGYVLNYGAAGGVGSGNGKTITVIDLKKKKVVGTIEVPLAPAAITHAKGKYLAVASYVDGNKGTGLVTLLKVDGINTKLIRTFKGFSGPFDIKFSPNNDYLYVTNFGSNNFAPFGRTLAVCSLLDTPEENKGEMIEVEVGIQPSGVAVHPDGTIIVSCYNTLYSDPVNYKGLTAGQGSLVYIDPKKFKVIKTIPTPASPANVVIASDGSYTYTSCYIAGVVAGIKN